jgi:hypothetical protein
MGKLPPVVLTITAADLAEIAAGARCSEAAAKRVILLALGKSIVTISCKPGETLDDDFSHHKRWLCGRVEKVQLGLPGTSNEVTTEPPEDKETPPRFKILVVGERENTSIEKSASRRESWLSPLATVWRSNIGGEFPFARAGKALKGLVAEHGVERVALHLRTYLAAHQGPDSRYVSVERFAQTFLQWAQAGPDRKLSLKDDHELGLAARYQSRKESLRRTDTDDRRPEQPPGSQARRQLEPPKVG